ncbi:hypothetical protein [Candidatus Poriferisodalis sp.]|uniref:hypothetical protein n=1 Tax=Candidatus Poriferisodalis sp. TaxID=3101277 RepID=UPI003AF5B1CD
MPAILAYLFVATLMVGLGVFATRFLLRCWRNATPVSRAVGVAAGAFGVCTVVYGAVVSRDPWEAVLAPPGILASSGIVIWIASWIERWIERRRHPDEVR